MNTDRNKNCISIVIKRADFETKTPDYPGLDYKYHDYPFFANPKFLNFPNQIIHSMFDCTGSWIIEEDYAAQPAGGPLL